LEYNFQNFLKKNKADIKKERYLKGLYLISYFHLNSYKTSKIAGGRNFCPSVRAFQAGGKLLKSVGISFNGKGRRCCGKGTCF